MGKLLENHWTSHMERQTDEAEHEMLICHFRLSTQCVSLRRDRRYIIGYFIASFACLQSRVDFVESAFEVKPVWLMTVNSTPLYHQNVSQSGEIYARR